MEMPLETGPQLQDFPVLSSDHLVVDVEGRARRSRRGLPPEFSARRCRAPPAGAAERLAARNCKVPDCCEAGAHPGFRVPQHCYHVENPSPRSVTPGGRTLRSKRGYLSLYKCTGPNLRFAGFIVVTQKHHELIRTERVESLCSGSASRLGPCVDRDAPKRKARP